MKSWHGKNPLPSLNSFRYREEEGAAAEEAFKAAAKDTGGAYGLWELTAPAAAAGPPPHIHEREDEALLCSRRRAHVPNRRARNAGGGCGNVCVCAPRRCPQVFQPGIEDLLRPSATASSGRFRESPGGDGADRAARRSTAGYGEVAGCRRQIRSQDCRTGLGRNPITVGLIPQACW